MLYSLKHLAKGLMARFAGFVIIVYAASSTLIVFGVAKLPLVH